MPIFESALVAVNVWLPAVPVNFMPRLVKLATPLTKSPALFNLLTPDRPLIVPSTGLGVMVTLLVEALNEVMVLPPESLAVKVFVPVKAVPLIWGVAATKSKWSSAPGSKLTL